MPRKHKLTPEEKAAQERAARLERLLKEREMLMARDRVYRVNQLPNPANAGRRFFDVNQTPVRKFKVNQTPNPVNAAPVFLVNQAPNPANDVSFMEEPPLSARDAALSVVAEDPDLEKIRLLQILAGRGPRR